MMIIIKPTREKKKYKEEMDEHIKRNEQQQQKICYTM